VEAHFGSISCLACPDDSNGVFDGVLFSAGYDKTVRAWNVDDILGGGGGRAPPAPFAMHKAHAAPVLTLAVRVLADGNSGGGSGRHCDVCVATGDRDGVVNVWRLRSARGSAPLAEHGPPVVLLGHAGHLTALAWAPPPAATAVRRAVAGADGASFGAPSPAPAPAPLVLLSGAQDGHLRAWDVPARASLANVPAHVVSGPGTTRDGSAAGSGAIGDIAFTEPADGMRSDAILTVTAGADRTICVLRPATGSGLAVIHRLTTHKDFIYSMRCVGGII
jgi:WD40 repeat protein